MTRRIEVTVLGTPAPKGSGRAMLNRKTGKAIHVPSGSKQNKAALRSWDVAVRESAIQALHAAEWNQTPDPDRPLFVDDPLLVQIVFRIRRPAGHWGKRGLKPKAPAFPAVKPDLDKITRATLDSLTGIIFDDDSRIIRSVCEKYYSRSGYEGATIIVEPMPPPT